MKLVIVLCFVVVAAAVGAADDGVVRLTCGLGKYLTDNYSRGVGGSEVPRIISTAMCEKIGQILEEKHRRTFPWYFRAVETELGGQDTGWDISIVAVQESPEDALRFEVRFNNGSGVWLVKQRHAPGTASDPPIMKKAAQELASGFESTWLKEYVTALSTQLTSWPVSCGGQVVFGDRLPWAVSDGLTWDKHSRLQSSEFHVERRDGREGACGYRGSSEPAAVTWTTSGPHKLVSKSDSDGTDRNLMALKLPSTVDAESSLGRLFLGCRPPLSEADAVATIVVIQKLSTPDREQELGGVLQDAAELCPKHPVYLNAAERFVPEPGLLSAIASTDSLPTTLLNYGSVSVASMLTQKTVDVAIRTGAPALADTIMLMFFASATLDKQQFEVYWNDYLTAASNVDPGGVAAWIQSAYVETVEELRPPPVDSTLAAEAAWAALASARSLRNAGQLGAALERYRVAWELETTPSTALELLSVVARDPTRLDGTGQATATILSQLRSQEIDEAYTMIDRSFDFRRANILASVVFSDLGDNEGAQAAISDAIQIDTFLAENAGEKKSPMIYNRLAEILDAAGDVDGASAARQQAFELYGEQGRPDLQSELGFSDLEPVFQYRPDLQIELPDSGPVLQYWPDLQIELPDSGPVLQYWPDLQIELPDSEPVLQYWPDLQIELPDSEPVLNLQGSETWRRPSWPTISPETHYPSWGSEIRR